MASGTRFSVSVQSSPMRLSNEAPAALKYRNETDRMPRQTLYQCSIRSTINLLSPYGDSGCSGCSSSTGTTGGVPYTAHVDENTKRETPLASNDSSSASVLPTLLWKYISGFSIDWPGAL